MVQFTSVIEQGREEPPNTAPLRKVYDVHPVTALQCEASAGGRVRVVMVSGPGVEGGEEVPYKTPIGILFGSSIRDSTNCRIMSWQKERVGTDE
jgi:hypothetical protein